MTFRKNMLMLLVLASACVPVGAQGLAASLQAADFVAIGTATSGAGGFTLHVEETLKGPARERVRVLDPAGVSLHVRVESGRRALFCLARAAGQKERWLLRQTEGSYLPLDKADALLPLLRAMTDATLDAKAVAATATRLALGANARAARESAGALLARPDLAAALDTQARASLQARMLGESHDLALKQTLLGVLAAGRPPALVPALIDALPAFPEAAWAGDVGRAAARVEGPAGARLLARALSRAQRPELRLALVHALGASGLAEAVPPLADLLEDRELAQDARRALAVTGQPAALDHLVIDALSRNGSQALQSLRLIAAMGTPRARRLVERVANEHAEPAVRTEAGRLLGR